jgi:hypothetical protein
LHHFETSGRSGNFWQVWKFLAGLEISGMSGKKWGAPVPDCQTLGAREDKPIPLGKHHAALNQAEISCLHLALAVCWHWITPLETRRER